MVRIQVDFKLGHFALKVLHTTYNIILNSSMYLYGVVLEIYRTRTKIIP